MKVIKSQGTKSRTTSLIDLFDGEEVSPSLRKEIHNEVGEFLVEQVLQSVASAKSPVQGESFPALSAGYKKKKTSEGGSGKPDLDLRGDLLDALDFKSTAEGLEIGFFNSQAWKADGHLKFSGADNGIPQRRFLPDEGQKFVKDIQSTIEDIITDKILERAELDKNDLKSVETKTELYEILKAELPGMSQAEMRDAVLRSDKLLKVLEGLDLVDLL